MARWGLVENWDFRGSFRSRNLYWACPWVSTLWSSRIDLLASVSGLYCFPRDFISFTLDQFRQNSWHWLTYLRNCCGWKWSFEMTSRVTKFARIQASVVCSHQLINQFVHLHLRRSNLGSSSDGRRTFRHAGRTLLCTPNRNLHCHRTFPTLKTHCTLLEENYNSLRASFHVNFSFRSWAIIHFWVS